MKKGDGERDRVKRIIKGEEFCDETKRNVGNKEGMSKNRRERTQKGFHLSEANRGQK